MNKDKYSYHKNQNSNKNWYLFAKNFKQFAKSNPGTVKPVHYALYFWIVELNNELRWPEKIVLHTKDTVDGIGIKDRRTYRKALSDLEYWGFIKIISISSNQYNKNQISLLLPEKDFLLIEPTEFY